MPSPSKQAVRPDAIEANKHNPRLYFNDERLDQLRTSLQEKGILVPLIVYEKPDEPGRFVLMDGERRWRSAVDLGFDDVPVQVIPAPDPVDNLVQMFNIHSVREEWSLVAIAIALRELMALTGETRESRLSDMTGLPRGTVRRAKRVLNLPEEEIDRIQKEAPLDRNEQVHRVDLYLEIERAQSVLSRSLPEIDEKFSRAEIIRQFARKREEGSLRNVTDFREVSKLAEAGRDGVIERDKVIRAAAKLIEDVNLNPPEVYERVAASAVAQHELAKKAAQLGDGLEGLHGQSLSKELRRRLRMLREEIDGLIQGASGDGGA